MSARQDCIIQIESEVIRGMAGEVVYQTKPCPYNERERFTVANKPAMVGSVSCKLCQFHGGIIEASNCVICNHE